VVRGVEEVAQQHGMSVFLSESQNNPKREVAVIEMFHQRRVDGIIVAAALLDAGYENRLDRLHVPTILVNQQAENPVQTRQRAGMLHSVSVDDYSGACRAVEHLLALGHRAIGYLGAGNRPRSNRIRQQAYRDAMSAAGVAVREGWTSIAPPERKYHTEDVADGQALLPRLLESGVTGVFCYNDMVAVGAMMACRERGLDVPGQVSIVGFDDIEIAQYVTPALTTVHQPKLRLGQVAMEVLVQVLVDRPVEDLVLPTELVVRSSTAGLS
jgi:LacI family transcriptional regulator/LacI family repressor for deo operon, udp, cdd, tsx, nupC, and nupG